jgi:succinate dehydrogenase/fumarate reductase cytochrome b subunit
MIMRKNKINEKKELYYKYERSLVVIVISIIFFCMTLFYWITEENSALSQCAEENYNGSCMNALVADGGVVRFIVFAPILFICFLFFLISGIRAFSARKKLGSDFTKVRKAVKNSTRSVEKKEYYDDTL